MTPDDVNEEAFAEWADESKAIAEEQSPRYLTPSVKQWLAELDKNNWSMADVLRQRDEARADREQMTRLMKHYTERAEKAEAEVERLRGAFHHEGDWVDALRLYDERNEAQAALDRVLALCDEAMAESGKRDAVLWASEIRAAIDEKP